MLVPSFHIERLAWMVTDPAKRTPRFLAIMWLFMRPLKAIQTLFESTRADVNARLPINGGRLAMETLLIARFGTGIQVINRRRLLTSIYIFNDEEFQPPVFVYFDEDIIIDPAANPVVYNPLAPPTFINLEPEDREEFDFEIILPFGNTTETRRIQSIVNPIRLAGKTYRIVRRTDAGDEITLPPTAG